MSGDRVEWIKISAPRSWQPAESGDELRGYYGGQTVRKGCHGEYTVVIVHVPYKGTFTVSGTKIVQLTDSAAMPRGQLMLIVFRGWEMQTSGHEMKLFDLYVADEAPRDDLPPLQRRRDMEA